MKRRFNKMKRRSSGKRFKKRKIRVSSGRSPGRIGFRLS